MFEHCDHTQWHPAEMKLWWNFTCFNVLLEREEVEEDERKQRRKQERSPRRDRWFSEVMEDKKMKTRGQKKRAEGRRYEPS